MRSRKKILDATLALIGSAGFEGVDIAAVAAAEGVTRQTVYPIFGTREDLVSQAIAGLAVEVLGDIRARLTAGQSAARCSAPGTAIGCSIRGSSPAPNRLPPNFSHRSSTGHRRCRTNGVESGSDAAIVPSWLVGYVM